MMIQLVVLCEVADKETNTHAGLIISSLAEENIVVCGPLADIHTYRQVIVITALVPGSEFIQQ